MKLELEKLAQCLQLPPDTLERWIRQGRIPVKKTDGLCDFKEDILDSWASKHHIRFSLIETPATAADGISCKSAEIPTLLSAMIRGGFHTGIGGNTVEDVLKQVVTRVPMISGVEQGILLEKLIERERLTSTGIGKGVAIPHPRNPLPGNHRDAMIVSCFLDNKIDFKSIDHRPVSVLFLMVCPTVKTHLFLLSRISFCLRDDSFIELLNSQPSPDEFYKAVETIENRIEKG
jgi:PTS system nitrogen regulatory IIA component